MAEDLKWLTVVVDASHLNDFPHQTQRHVVDVGDKFRHHGRWKWSSLVIMSIAFPMIEELRSLFYVLDLYVYLIVCIWTCGQMS